MFTTITRAAAPAIIGSKSSARVRPPLHYAKVPSAIRRSGKTSKPLAPPERSMISTFDGGRLHVSFGPRLGVEPAAELIAWSATL